jgi:choline dehydrogenase-like flavoprotein
VGGGTLTNYNLCARLPPVLFAAWRQTYGLKHLGFERLAGLYHELERGLPVSDFDTSTNNAANTLFFRGVNKLKYKGEWLSHNRAGCATSGFCALGCPYDAKQNSLKIHLGEAVKLGTEILADTWAASLRFAGGRCVGVDAVVRDPLSGAAQARVTIDARAVCVSAGATGTPALLLRSRTPDPHRHLGARLWLSPQSLLLGEWAEARAVAWQGMPQSYGCSELIDHTPGSDKRVWLVPSFAHPAGMSAILAGFGEAHLAQLEPYPRLVGVSAVVTDSVPGRLNVNGPWSVDLDYTLAPADARQLLFGLREAGRILFAAGARRVIVPTTKPLVIDALDALDASFAKLTGRAHDLPLVSTGPHGTVWMGDDPARAPVASDGRFHGVDGLWIADTSLYCSAIGVPPQLTAFALGLHVGRSIA